MDKRILWNKDPALHRYYLSNDNKRFFKCYANNKEGRRLFEAEKGIFKKVQFSEYFPHLYSFIETHDKLILEMEFVPFLPIKGHLTEKYNDIKAVYSKEQIDNILEKFNNLEDVFAKLKLVLNDRVLFEFSLCHIIYDYIKNRLVFIDLSDADRANSNNLGIIEVFRNYIKELPVGESNLDSINKNICADLFLIEKVNGHPNEMEQSGIYFEGEKLFNDLQNETKGLIQHTIYINDKKYIGHRCHFTDRAQIYKIPSDELKDKTVLDLGCNIGGGLVYFAEQGAKKVIGIESHPVIFGYLTKFINYCKKIHGIYNNIEIAHGDLRYIKFPDADICFYLSGLSYYGNEKFNKDLSEKVLIVYLEGHSDDINKDDSGVKKVMNDFGDKWSWEFLGRTDNEYLTGKDYKPRPVYKGVKNEKNV